MLLCWRPGLATWCASHVDARVLCLARFDITRALHIDNLKGCTVFTGPIAGSVLMEGCTDCTFVFASRQIRLHTSHRCDFYLHVLSRPIIEHCDTLRFAPYGLNYPQWPAQLRAAELDKPRAKTMWQNVDDFGWHRTQHSPNWSQLPYEEYLLAWPASASEVAAELHGALAVRCACCCGQYGCDADTVWCVDRVCCVGVHGDQSEPAAQTGASHSSCRSRACGLCRSRSCCDRRR